MMYFLGADFLTQYFVMTEVQFKANVLIVEDSGCWEWQKALRGNSGYGTLKIKGKMVGAHRYSYELFKSLIPPGLLVCHTCDNPKCVNPEHLFLGSNSDNMKDAFSKGRLPHLKTAARKFEKGRAPHNRKITVEQLIQIRNLLKQKMQLADIATTMHLSISAIKDISAGRPYRLE